MAKPRNVPPPMRRRVRSFPEILEQVAKLANNGSSIDDIAKALIDADLIDTGEFNDAQQIGRIFAFAVLSWQTMLYQPAFQTTPLQQFALADVLDGYTGQAFMTLQQDQSRITHFLTDFLLGFGLMISRENVDLGEDLEDCQAFEKIAVVRAEEFNAALLRSLARVNIK